MGPPNSWPALAGGRIFACSIGSKPCPSSHWVSPTASRWQSPPGWTSSDHGAKRFGARSRCWPCRYTHGSACVCCTRPSTASGTLLGTAQPISAFIPSGSLLRRSMLVPCSTGSKTARRTSPTPAHFSPAASPRWLRSARHADGLKRQWNAYLTRLVCCASTVELRPGLCWRFSVSAMGDKTCDVAHLAAGLGFGFSVEVQLGQRVVERIPPFLDLAADQVLHPRVGMMLDRAERQAA